MFEAMDEALRVLRDLVAGFEPSTFDGAAARRLAGLFGEIERCAAAGRTLAWARVESSGAWRSSGARSAAHEMAQATGSTVGQAMAALGTAERLENLEATGSAFRSGKLSLAQAQEVSAAAAVAPSSEAGLLATARRESLTGLRQEAHRVRVAAEADGGVSRHDQIHRSRFVSFSTDTGGGCRMEGRLAAEVGARVRARMEAEATRLFQQARKAGRRESHGAYLADALANLVLGRAGSVTGRGAQVIVRVDQTALARGKAQPGELCEIDGVPIPVAVARDFMTDGLVSAVLSNDAEISAVRHFRRTINARLRTALEARDPCCVVPGCAESRGLEIDHLQPFAHGGPTTLANLARLCRHHHRLKTLEGWTLQGPPGNWAFEPPPMALAAAVASEGRTEGRAPP